MGLSNRDYARDDDPYNSGWDPTGGQRQPVSLPAKIAIVFFVSFILTAAVPELMAWVGLSREGLLGGRVWQLLTYGFVTPPSNIIGMIFSCLIVYSFGQMMEQMVGSRELLYFVIAAVLFGGVAHVITTGYGTAGASHVVEAVILWLALRRPHERINLFFLFNVPLWGLATVFVGLSIVGALGYHQQAAQGLAGYGIGFPSLLGALLFAFLHERFRWSLSSLVADGISSRISEKLKDRQLSSRRAKSNLKVFSPERSDAAADAGNAEEVDRILQKIHEQGEASLTSKERKLLAKESKRLRGRS